MATSAIPAAPREKFSVDKAVYGDITYLTIAGTLNVDFVAKKVAGAIKTPRVLLDMRRVRRFASWGMTEWMDFLRLTAKRDLYIVECSPYALSQLNLITGLLGHAKLVSYYTSFRCSKCGEEIENTFIIPRDRELIRELPRRHVDCPTCGGNARLEEYPAAFFETIADRPAFDIDDEVLAFLRSNLRYDIEADLDRFRAHRTVKNQYTYLRLSGDVGALPLDPLVQSCQGTTVIDLERVLHDRADVAPWHVFVSTVMEKVDSLQLLNCPVGFLERGVATKDLKKKLKVRTFALSYDCAHCERTSVHMIDVANTLEYLAEGTSPTVNCPTCRASLLAALSMDVAMLLRTLPARDRDPALDKFLSTSRTIPNEKLENCLVPSAAAVKPAKANDTKRVLYLALGLGTLLVAGVAVIGFLMWKERTEPTKIAIPMVDPQQPTTNTFTRPEWIVSQVPSSAYCHDMINRVMCVGVSAYRGTKEDGVTEASDAALEELVNAVALKISDPFFRESVLPQYSEARAKQLSALQSADLDRKTDPMAAAAFAAADETVRKARKRVVESLQSTGGAAVPTQRSDWYWEEYAGESGKPNEVLVFVRYDVSLDAMRALVETYSAGTVVKGTTAMTAYPALGWRYSDFKGGVVLTKPHRKLVSAGINPQQLITAVDEHRVTDAGAFARRMNEAPDDVKLTVVSGDAPPTVIKVDL
jgi:DNA-directed RNA polymerase subunit RPC12/RpoP